MSDGTNPGTSLLVCLEFNQPYTLCGPIGLNVTVIVEIIEGTAWLHGSSSGYEIQGCQNRCWTKLRSDSLPGYEAYDVQVVQSSSASQASNGGTASQTAFKPVAADIELGPGDVVMYSGPLNVILTGTSTDHARIRISFSSEQL